MTGTKEYYDSDTIGQLYGLPGGGVVGLMVGEQLHPPMVYNEKIWRDGNLWKYGALESTRHLAEMAEINKDSFVLDVGSGVGGPARYLAKTYGSKVHGINISKLQTMTAKNLTKKLGLESLVDFSLADAQHIPFNSNTFSIVWTMNMFYHVPNKPNAFREFYNILHPNGVLAFDDWVITDNTSEEEHQRLKEIWQNPSFGTIGQYTKLIENTGFTVEKLEDLSSIGRELMPKYFEQVFDNNFRPRIISLIPKYGSETASILKRDILFTIQLYQEDKFGYYQLTARK